MKVLFTYLTSFSGHGGIEKFNKSFVKTLDENGDVSELRVISLHDKEQDERYLRKGRFSAFEGRKIPYLIDVFTAIPKYDILILGHINVAIVAIIAKILRPSIKIITITHGIDIWMNLSIIKKYALRKSSKILAVSNYTKSKLIELYSLPPDKILIFHNTIDPYITPPSDFRKPAYLLDRYKISEKDPVLLTICRLSANEAYKGCDTVIACLPKVLQRFPGTKYLIVGKYDQDEKARLDTLLRKTGVENHVIFSGFVPDSELMDHFLIGDIFIMPSINEGFGIVYIESMASGVPVIAGNKDGSVDALDNGQLGELVDPFSQEQIVQAIDKILCQPGNHESKVSLQRRAYEKFGYDKYKERLNRILREI